MSKKSINDVYVGKLLSFMIFPFFTFLYCFKTIHLKSSRLIFFLFGLVFAWSMHYTNTDRGIDMLEIIHSFYRYTDLSFNDVLDSLKNMFSDDGNIRSYNFVVYYVTRLFSENHHFMFFIASLPFNYFMVKSLSELLRGFRKISLPLFIAVILFLMPKDFFSIQNFRFATATWMAIYGTLKFLYYNNKRYCILILGCVVIHPSFIFYNVILLIYFLLKGVKISTLIKIYYASIPFAFMSGNLVSNFNFNFLPAVFQNWIGSYLDAESFQIYGNMSSLNGSGFFFISSGFILFKTFVYLYIPLKIDRLSNIFSLNIEKDNFFIFYLLLFSITNIVQFVPSLGSRFLGLVHILSIFCVVKYLYSNYLGGKFIFVIFLSCSFELLTETLYHDYMVQDRDFFFNNIFSLVYKFTGVSSFI